MDDGDAVRLAPYNARMTTSFPIMVEERFRGPDGMGNGGYVSGLVAEAVGGPATIRLLAPTPLGRSLQLVRGNTIVRLVDGDRALVEGEPLNEPLHLAPPSPPTMAAIDAARPRFPTSERHMAPSCFVCGPERDCVDALCLFTARDPQTGLAADTWCPDAALADGDGLLAPRYLWAALDCPSYFATGLERMALLAGITAQVERRPRPGERLTVTGWALDRDGRKHHAASVIHDASGEIVALARALWIEPAPA